MEKKVIQLTKVFKPAVRAWELLLSCVYRGGFSRVLKAEFLDLDCLGDNTSWVKKTKNWNNISFKKLNDQNK